jgi:superfamily I DNA/RNA helicase
LKPLNVISFFRWCENPADRVAGFRVLQLLPGIGPATAARIQDQVEARPGRSDILASIDVPKAAAEDWPGFAKLFTRLRKAKAGWHAEFELVRRWYEPHLHRMYDDAHLREADIGQLEQIAAGYESRERLTLDPPDATSGRARAKTLDEDYTILSTIHRTVSENWAYFSPRARRIGCAQDKTPPLLTVFNAAAPLQRVLMAAIKFLVRSEKSLVCTENLDSPILHIVTSLF